MIAVLEDAVSRLALISLVPTVPDMNFLARLPDSSDPLKVAIQQQWQIEESNRLLYGTAALNKASFEGVTDQLGQSTRTLCRQLRKHKLTRQMVMLNETTANVRSPHLTNCQQSLSVCCSGWLMISK